MIETRLLRQFIAVAEELHFHRAAIRLHMAQPPLSQAINRLEEKVGFALFVRTKRNVKLTPAGKAFLETAYRTLNELDQGVEYAREVSEGISGKLTVASISIAYYEPLLNAMHQFRETFPKVRLVIREMPSSAQAKALLSGEADIAFMRPLPMPPEIIESQLILDEKIIMALPANHEKAELPAVDLRDFANDDFVFTPQSLGSGYHNQLIDLCEAAGFYPKVVQEASQVHTLIGFVASGFGVALVPESMAKSIVQDRVRFRPVQPLNDQPNQKIGLYMSWNKQKESILRTRFTSMLTFGDSENSK